MTSRRFTPPTGPRSGERDRQVRRVRLVTRSVASLAVLGTAVFGGLAAAGHGSSGLGSGSAAAQTALPASTDSRTVQDGARARIAALFRRPRARRAARRRRPSPRRAAHEGARVDGLSRARHHRGPGRGRRRRPARGRAAAARGPRRGRPGLQPLPRRLRARRRQPGGGAAGAVGPLLLEAVAAALRAAEITDGDVDPTVAPPWASSATTATSRWCSRRGRARRRQRRASRRAGARSGSTRGGTVRAPPGPGSTSAQRPRRWRPTGGAGVHAATGAGTLVALGGDIALAGEAPEGAGRSGSPTTTATPAAPRERSPSARAASRPRAPRSAAGAPGGGHHIVDPRRGGPPRSWRTVSVAAGTCVNANIASTAAIVRGARPPAGSPGAGCRRASSRRTARSCASAAGRSRAG